VRDGTKFCRYFSSAADAVAFQAIVAGPEDEEGKPLSRHSPDFVAEWAPDEPVQYAKNYKHTVCPPSRIGEFVTNTHKDW